MGVCPLWGWLLALVIAWPVMAWPASAVAQPKRRGRKRPVAEQKQPERGQKSSAADKGGQQSGTTDKGGQKSGPTKTRGRAKKQNKVQEVDFTGLDISGRLHTPQLLYFLRRVQEELQRAALERRSFLPELYRSMHEDPL